MGRPEQAVVKKREPQKSPISKGWISTSAPPRSGVRVSEKEMAG